MTLRFEDAKGLASTLAVQVPVGAPEGTAAPAGHAH